MQQRKSKPTDFWKEFERVVQARPERRPTGPGWMQLVEIMKRFKMGKDRAWKHLREQKAERFEGSRLIGGRLMRAVWFRCK